MSLVKRKTEHYHYYDILNAYICFVRIRFLHTTLILLCFSFLSVRAQNARIGAGFSNHGTAWPVVGYPKLFYTAFHPGLDIIAEKKINKKEKNQWWAELGVGTFYHRFFQTAAKLNLNLHHRYFFNTRVYSDVALGAGYLHSFYQYQVFKLKSDGTYVKESGIKGRPQFIMGTIIGCGVALKKSDPEKFNLLIQFRTNIQGPFAGSFVPIVPYNAIMLGITTRLNKCEKKNETAK